MSHVGPSPIDGPPYYTYAQLHARAGAVATDLVAIGLVPGDRVALFAGNDLDFAAIVFGALYVGLTLIPISTASADHEVRFRLEHARARLLIHDAARADAASRAAPDAHRRLGSALGRATCNSFVPQIFDDSHDALLLYTSGTTGSAKAARISRRSLTRHTATIAERVLRLSAQDVVLAVLPITHSFGLRLALLAPIAVGATALLGDKFDTARVRYALEHGGVTWFPGVPTMFSALARSGNPIVAPRLRWCLSAGAALPVTVAERATKVLGVPVRQGYGMTEATFCTIDTPDDPHGSMSVGRRVEGVSLAIVDEHGQRIDSGQSGEIIVRGPNVMTGYLDDDEATQAVVRDGWLHTGDLGYLDSIGRLTVVDRKKDLIIRSGWNVVPSEVEAAILRVPGVESAIAVGVPDAHRGEEIAVVLVVDASFDEGALAAAVRRELAEPSRPRLFATTDELPIGPSGKALRRVVREAIWAGTISLRQLE